MDPMKETFSEDCLSTDESNSFEARVFAEIEKTKGKLRDIFSETNPDKEITFYTDEAGVVNMVIGETPDHIYTNEFERAQFKPGSDVKYLMRKLEDLFYAKKHGEFPEEVAKHEIADPEELP